MVTIQKPALAPCLLARYLPGEGLFLISEHRSDVLAGEAFGALLPLLTGTHSVDEILDQAAAQCDEAQVLYALELLGAHGYLVEGPPLPGSQEGYWSARKAKSSAPAVTLVNHSSHSAAELAELLNGQNIKVLPAAEPAAAALRVVLVDDYLDPKLSSYNVDGLARGEPWMLVKPTGNILWLGPIFVPGQTGCWACMADRLRLNRRVLRYLERRCGTALKLPAVSAPVTRALAAALLGNEILQWLHGDSVALVGTLRTFDTVSQTLENHVLTRRPQCAACGTPAPSPGPLRLDEPQQAPVSRDGGFRSRTATQVLGSLQQHVSQVLGMVTHLQPLATQDDDIHVYVSGQNLGATGGTLDLLAKNLRNRSSGKGITEVQARASALCESIERYATVFQGDEPHIVATAAELGDAAILPNSCMLFSASQYAERAARNVGADGFTRIPMPLLPQQPVWWSPVFSLVDHQQKYCPTAYLYFHSEALHDPIGVKTCPPDSNGVATGSTYPEAVLQGLLELIERDAVALWWYPRTAVPRVDLESFGSEFLCHCLEYHRKIGRELWVLEVTSDLGIPTFVGVSRKVAGEQQIIMGFGAHVDARIAVQRAVAETNQLLAGIQGQLQSSAAPTNATTRWLRSATIEKERYLQGNADRVVTAAQYKEAPQSVAAALRQCLGAIQRAGLAAYTLDLTRPDIDLKVVRVLCPGLRHFWARLAPGRLYEVPWALGRVTERQQEQDLNPTAMFL